MCQHDTPQFPYAAPFASASAPARLAVTPPATSGSRRQRLWDLPGQTHCPLIGVCLPMPLLRRLLDKAGRKHAADDDYTCHVSAVAECGRRGAVAEALQRELDRRYAAALRKFAAAKTEADLAALWEQALHGVALAGALWATLSHARCGHELCERVCRTIHMVQHQLGACNYADLQQLEQLRDENLQLNAELGTLKARHARTLAQHSSDSSAIKADLMRGRAQVIMRESALAAMREQLDTLNAAIPDLQQRQELLRRVDWQQRRMRELEQDRAAWQQRAEQESARALQLAATLAGQRAREVDFGGAADGAAPLEGLRDKAVLCVGGRTASVPAYRQMIEYTGGRFLHHDGGSEHSAAQLEASLAAADLVICQTGCVSHGAYWRVKDHCKRTGKRCVFVDKPSSSSLARSLHALGVNAQPEDEGCA